MASGTKLYKRQEEQHVAVKLAAPKLCPCCKKRVTLWARFKPTCYVCFVKAYAETTKALRLEK